MNWWYLTASLLFCTIEIAVILWRARKRPLPEPTIILADEERKIRLMAYQREAMRYEAAENDALWAGQDH